MKSTLVLLASFALLSLHTSRAQEATGEKNNSACLEMVIDEINKDLQFLIENPEGNDSAIYHLTRLRNRILAKMQGNEEGSGRREQDYTMTSNYNTTIQDRVNELQKERKRLLKSSSESNPIIRNLDKQIEELEQSKKEH